MKTMTKKQFLENQKFYLNEIKHGKIFIYPTDTIYGIGCIATNSLAINKIRQIKQRDEKPFSIIVPNKQWVIENCKIKKDEQALNKLPGPYTIILELKNKEVIAKKELVGEVNTIGVRMPNNWFSQFIQENNLTFVTTSVNISGRPHIKQISDLKQEIKNQIDYIIDDGLLENPPSTIINLVNNTEIRR